MNAHDVYQFLKDLKKNGVDLKKIAVNYKKDNVSADVLKLEAVEEDLFDSETNNKLESIVFIHDVTEA